MRTFLCLCACIAAGLISGCRGGQTTHPYTVSTGGSADRGRGTIVAYECAKCHTIPGIPGANGVVGPPLVPFAANLHRRKFRKYTRQSCALGDGTAIDETQNGHA